MSEARKYFEDNNMIDPEKSVSYILFRSFFYDIKCSRLLKMHLAQMPSNIQNLNRSTKFISYINLLLFISMLLFSLFAYKLEGH